MWSWGCTKCSYFSKLLILKMSANSLWRGTLEVLTPEFESENYVLFPDHRDSKLVTVCMQTIHSLLFIPVMCRIILLTFTC